MGKHLIIDGYNLLGYRGALGDGRGVPMEALRETLLRKLASYRLRTGHAVTVVFDGWKQGGSHEGHEHRVGVQVVYSRRGEQADQVIRRMVREYGSDCAVVSSDREVAGHARKMGAFVMGADEFDHRLQTDRASGKRYRGMVGPGDKAERVTPRRKEKKGNPKKLPKAVRKRQRQLRSF